MVKIRTKEELLDELKEYKRLLSPYINDILNDTIELKESLLNKSLFTDEEEKRLDQFAFFKEIMLYNIKSNLENELEVLKKEKKYEIKIINDRIKGKLGVKPLDIYGISYLPVEFVYSDHTSLLFQRLECNTKLREEKLAFSQIRLANEFEYSPTGAFLKSTIEELNGRVNQFDSVTQEFLDLCEEFIDREMKFHNLSECKEINFDKDITSDRMYMKKRKIHNMEIYNIKKFY